MNDQVASRHVELVGGRQDDRLAGRCLGPGAVVRARSNFDRVVSSRGEHHDLVARLHHAGRDRAGVAAKVLVGPNHVLHRKPEIARRLPAGRRRGLQ